MNYAVEAFLDSLPADVHALTRRLQALLLALDPRIQESFKWNVPFYSYHGLLCYLNPMPKKHLVQVGFVAGVYLADEAGLLTGTGKQIRLVPVASEADVYRPELLALLQQAMLFNEEKARQQRRKQQPLKTFTPPGS